MTRFDQPMSIECEISFNVNDDPSSLRTFSEKLEHAIQGRAESEIVVNLSKCGYLGPGAVAILAAVKLDLTQHACNMVIQPPEQPVALRHFCQWSGLDAVIAGNSPPAVHVESDFNVLPLRAFKAANIRAAEPIVDMVRSRLHISDEWHDSLAICVNEVMQNIQDHAESPIGGMLSARFLAKSQEVRIAIVDRGIGVCRCLQRRFPDTTPVNAIRRVFEGGYTSLSRINNSGLGMAQLKAIVNALSGRLFVMSAESTAACQPKRQPRYDVLPFQFTGTGVFFSLPLQET